MCIRDSYQAHGHISNSKMRNVKNTQEDRESVGSSVDSPPDDLAIIHNRKELIPDRQDLSPRPAPRQPGNSATRSSHPRSSASTRRINPSTAPARYGGNSGDRGSRWPVARSSASCALWMNTYSRRILGWQVWGSPRTDLALDALEMALWRRGGDVDGLTINGL